MLCLLRAVPPAPQEKLDCEASGGSWEVDYMMPYTTYVKSGNVNIPITNYIPIYGCEEPR